MYGHGQHQATQPTLVVGGLGLGCLGLAVGCGAEAPATDASTKAILRTKLFVGPQHGCQDCRMLGVKNLFDHLSKEEVIFFFRDLFLRKKLTFSPFRSVSLVSGSFEEALRERGGSSTSPVVELGPGLGALTFFLNEALPFSFSFSPPLEGQNGKAS